ncbi:MAG: metallophosphoesterase [Clostridia bacterium]|nr:metallophosphoesterase [Clostridia bacterium]
MISLKKTPGRDFLVLNLSDPQLGDGEWEAGHPNRRLLEDCVRTLVARVHPDLITVSGDLAWAGNDRAYDALADFLDTFGIPWAPVWGNHDNQEGPEKVEAVVSRYLTHPLCVYERGPADLGNGNYVIRIEEDGRPVSALIMMDSHDRAPYVNEAGAESNEWAKLIPEQLVWYREQIAALTADGCHDSTMILHIPIYAYREAFAAAFKAGIDPKTVLPEDAEGDGCWNPGYESSIGVLWEGIGSYPADDGVFPVIRELGHTKHILAGHDHVDNYVISYEGVTFIYSLKAGPGCYWDPRLNGGTVLAVGSEGVRAVRHEYVKVE